jgi:sugar phosphate permease
MRVTLFYGWWIVCACFFITLYVSSIIFYGFTALFEPLVREFGWSYTQISFASSLRGLEMGILAPLVGIFADRFGSRKLMFYGVIAVGMGLILLGFTRSLLTFYGAIILISFGAGGCTSVVTMTVVAHWFRRKIGMALAIMTSGFGASGLMIPLVVMVIDACGWRTAVITFGIGMWIIGIPLSLVVRDRPEPCGYYPDGDTLPLGDSEIFAKNRGEKKRFLDLLKMKELRYLNLAEAIRFMVLTAVMIHIMPYLSTVGWSRTGAGLIAGAIPLVSVIGRLLFGWLSDLFNKRLVMAWAYTCLGCGMLVLPYAGTNYLIFLFLIPFSMGTGGITVLRGAILREYYGRDSFGAMIGIVMGFGAAGGIVGPTLAGFIFDTLGNYQIVWSWFSGCVFLAIFLVIMMGDAPSAEEGYENDSESVNKRDKKNLTN